ncbi:MAG: zinc-ribbon domain containing protein [Syntrophaceae bacterium]|nr:zinc-ribbon domain containing protein [Syntrophaceae bacterium]
MFDETIQCIQCDRNFVFSAEQRKQFMARGFDPPTRCPECRKRKAKFGKSKGNDDRKRNRHRDYISWEE